MKPFRPDPFKPATLLAGAHRQTVAARLLRPTTGVALVRERLELPDGDFLDLDFARVDSLDASSSPFLTVVLHGLEGSAQSKYALETYRRLARHGVAAVGMNFRSCSGELNRNARLYHSGETEDIRFVLGTLAARYGDKKLGAIGFSLGGNVLLKYLGEGSGIPETLVAAAAVSVPFDLSAGADFLERGLARVYRWRLMRSLRAKALAKEHLLAGLLDMERVRQATTFREFDDAATGPLHGFAGAEDYYSKSSSQRYLHAIRTPTLLVHSLDDPFLPPDRVPRSAVAENDRLQAVFSPSGGHVGFLEGSPVNPGFWAERTVARFVAERLADSS